MADWALTTLDRVATISSGSAPPKVPGDFDVMGANGRIGSAPVSNFGPGYLVGRVGAAGAITRVDYRCWASDNTLTVVPTTAIDPAFLGHMLMASDLEHLATQTAQPLITQLELRRQEMCLPPLDEQQRIAEILDSIDDAIRASERVLAKLGDLRSALLAQLALHYADNGTPVPLSSTGDWLSGGTPNTNEPSFWGGPIPWITASSLRGKYLSHSTRTLTAAGVRSGSRIVPPGTLICVVRGMSLKREFRVGIAAVPLAFGQDCKALRTTDDWLPAYLHLQLSARESEVLRLVDEASHGTGRLQMPLLGALLVDRISLNEQQRVVTLFQAHEVRVAAQEAELVKLRQLRAGLAEDLLSGRVRTVAT